MEIMKKPAVYEPVQESMEGGELHELPHVQFKEPSLEESLFPLKIHERHAGMKKEMQAWLEKTVSARWLRAVDDVAIPDMACTMFPLTIAEPPSRLMTLHKFMVWLLMVDDTVDASTAEGRFLQAQSTCRHCRESVFVEEGATPPASLEGEVPDFITVGREFWAEVRVNMPRSQQARFKTMLMAFAEGLEEEERITLASNTPPSLQEYMKLRYGSYALGAFYLLSEYSLGMELDEEALQSSLIQQLHEAAGQNMYCVNDIISFAKEFEEGKAYFNIVYLLHIQDCEKQKAGPVSPKVAVSRAWRMAQDRQLDCVRLAQQIANSPLLASKPGLLRYVESLCLATPGNWFWHLQTGRYTTTAAPA